jgi:hypothetical protein
MSSPCASEQERLFYDDPHVTLFMTNIMYNVKWHPKQGGRP